MSKWGILLVSRLLPRLRESRADRGREKCGRETGRAIRFLHHAVIVAVVIVVLLLLLLTVVVAVVVRHARARRREPRGLRPGAPRRAAARPRRVVRRGS